MKQIKPLLIGLVLFSASLFLSACQYTDDWLTQKLLDDSGIATDPKYIQMDTMKASKELDDDGFYIAPTLASGEQQSEGSQTVEVSFGQNHYLDIEYFRDADMTEPLTSEHCSLKPGDSIYAKFTPNKNPHTNLYRLKEFRVYEYAQDGTLRDQSSHTVSNDPFLLLIPENSTGFLSIMPIGTYPNRVLSLEAHYIDDADNHHTLKSAGSWSVNEEACNDDTAEISAVDSYVLRFTYDTENYFFVKSNPKCFTHNPNQVGFVEFFEESPVQSKIDQYQVELHEYIILNITPTEAATVKVNGIENSVIKKNKIFSLEKLKYGDTVIIETAGDCSFSGDDKHFSIFRDPIGDQYRYTITITEDLHKNDKAVLPEGVTVNREFTLTLNPYCSKGECYFELDGEIVNDTISVQENQELIVYCEITDKGYIFSDKADIPWYKFDSKTKHKKVISITRSLDNSTVTAGDYFDIVRKEG